MSSESGNRLTTYCEDKMDHDGDLLSSVVLPLMNVDRRTVNGEVDPTEPNQQQIYITSAGQKGTYAYERLIELFIQSVINSQSSFVFGCDYRVPVMHGLLNKSYINDLKASASFKEDAFAREQTLNALVKALKLLETP